jgi:RNA polymerase sigma-70 factor, ECF subfamily
MEHARAGWTTGVISFTSPFEEFFEAEQDRLLRILWMVTGNHQEAEDIAQEAFLRVWERWPRVSSMESPVGYLHRAAMNIFRNRYRRAAVAIRKAMHAPPPPDAFGAVEDRSVIAGALATLTERQRAALVLTELLGYSADEAGRMLGVRASTVRSLTARARAVLKEAREASDE